MVRKIVNIFCFIEMSDFYRTQSYTVMLATFIAGERIAVMIPHAYLDEVHGALAHGEIL